MSPWTLILRSVRFFWRTHLGVVIGTACATAVLVGALLVGDSVRLSLREQALHRIGRVHAALAGGDRLFRADLADRVASELDGAAVAPVLQLRGVASAADAGSAARAGIVDVFAVEDRFFAMAPDGRGTAAPAPGHAHLNAPLADQLGVRTGDVVLLRVEKPTHLPRDAAMATVDDLSFALRIEVDRVLDDAGFGRFSLRASQIPPFDLFVSLPWLWEQLDLSGRANLLLAGSAEAGAAGAAAGGEAPDLVERADAAMRRRLGLADLELRVASVPNRQQFELQSDRVFLDDAVGEAAAALEPGLVGVLTYFVNELRLGQRATPYSMVAAIGPLSDGAGGGAPAGDALTGLLGDAPPDGIVLNEWTARDLQAEVGDRVEVDYFVMGPRLRLVEQSHTFVVHAIVQIAGAAADRSLMPAFPGIADGENCRDWEPGIPIDLERIRDTDEEYWDRYGGTPKGFVRLSKGRALWGNRFGSLTAIRGPADRAPRIETGLPRTLDPARLGLYFQDVRGPALAAGTPATDFGGLFLGLSCFLILAALLLTALLFVFGVEQRANEIGALLALGLRPSRVRRQFLAEALLLALVGGVVGAFVGTGYTRGVLAGLGSLWRDAVGATTLTFHARPATVALGALAALATAVAAIAIALRRTFHRPAVELLNSKDGIPSVLPSARTEPHRARISWILAVASPVLALALVLAVGTDSDQAAMAFFGAGALLLCGALAACRLLLVRWARSSSDGVTSVRALGVRNSGRRVGRSLATIALLASGTFLVVAVQANRLEPPRDPSERASGTGGFSLFARSTLPLLRDLGTAAGQDAYGLDPDALVGVDFVPLRVRDGDDASCLNLSLPQHPRLVGVDPAALAARGAFRFAQAPAVADGKTNAGTDHPWLALDADLGDDVVPAIGDQASVTWTLHKAVGDTLDYRDDAGRPFRVQIVGTVADSILQGNLVVSEAHFRARFPSVSGYRMLLIDSPPDRASAVASHLSRALSDLGLEVTTTAERLAAFQAVQNTYLLIFQALGGLGLLLGSVGLGMVVLRNALERRSELAIASALGLRQRSIRQLVWSEHGLLLGLGLATGVVAALLAVLPGLRGSGGGPSAGPTLALVVVVALSGALWVGLATRLATRGPLLRALRND